MNAPVASAISKPLAGRIAPPRPAPSTPSRTSTFQEGGLDGHWDRRLRSGDVRPDRIIDLHGHNLDRAWAAIDDGLERAIGRGERLVLLITGHARPGEPPVQRGKIRAAVHDWLAASRHAHRIAAVRGASKRHGGGGSLYLILRR
jgi:DNA-nicking Smr family endonuclease